MTLSPRVTKVHSKENIYSPSMSYVKSQNSLPQVRHTRVKSDIGFDSKASLGSDPLNTDRSSNNNINNTSNRVQISKQDLTQMLREVKEQILQETVNKNENFVSQVANKHSFLDNKIAFTKQEIKQVLIDYKQKIRSEIMQDKEKRVNTENAYYQNMYSMAQQYNNFQSILWYYYIYNPELYRQLIDEYNHRLHNQLLGSLGLTEQFSSSSPTNKEKIPEGGVKFNVSANNAEDNIPKSPNKSNIRKSLFIGQNPDLLASTVNPSPLNNRKSIYLSGDPLTRKSIVGEAGLGSRKSIYQGGSGGQLVPGEASRKSIYQGGSVVGSRKSIYQGGNNESKPSLLQNAGKLSMLPEANFDSNNPSRIRKKSIMPSKELREALKNEDLNEDDDQQGKAMKRNTKYVPILGKDVLGNNRNSNLVPNLGPNNEAPRKSLFPQKKASSVHVSSNADNRLMNSVSSSASSDFDIYDADRKLSVKKSSVIKKPSAISSGLGLNIANSNELPVIKVNPARGSNIEERDIIVERYNIRITKPEYEALKYHDVMSEGLIDFFLSYLKEKQAFLSQKKLALNQLRILYFPLSFFNHLRRKRISMDQIGQIYMEKEFSMSNFDKILIPVRANDLVCNFFLVDVSKSVILYYELTEEELNENSESLANVKRFLKELLGKTSDWQTQLGAIEKIHEKKSAALYFCKSVYFISQGIQDLSNREKKTYEFKQKLINLLIKMPKVLEEKGEIEDFRIFDL